MAALESSPFSLDYCTAYDHRSRRPLKVRNRYGRGDRGQRAAPGRGAGRHRRLPGHNPKEIPYRFRAVVRARQIGLGGLLRHRSRQGPRGSQRRYTLPWSNGQTEGQITKLKLVKRQMYGRGKLDLLQARVIGAG